MIKIISSVLILFFAFATGVVLGAIKSRPQIQKIASFAPAARLKSKPPTTTAKTKKPPPNKNSKLSQKYRNQKRKGYTVLLSSFKKEENAQKYAHKVSKKGYDAFYFSKNIKGKTWHRVGVGSFSTKSTAESLKKQLTENRLGKGSIIATIPSAEKH